MPFINQENGLARPAPLCCCPGSIVNVDIDRTGLTGRFNFEMDFAPFDSDAAANSSAPSLFTAIQEQLGLRSDTTKATLDGLVIERAERPSAN